MGSIAGFTLIELSVVIFILGLTLSFVFPRLMSLEDVDLKLAARRLSGTIRYLSDQAGFAKTTYILECHLKDGSYLVRYCLPGKDPPYTPQCFKDRSSLGKGGTLPKGIQFQDIVLRGEKIGPDVEEAVPIPFFLDGFLVHTIIHLKNERNKSYTLELNPVTGRVAITEGYVEAGGQTPPS